jgi:ankyrin repeat protein
MGDDDHVQWNIVKAKPKKEKVSGGGGGKLPAEMRHHYMNVIHSYKTERCKLGLARCPDGKMCFYAHSEGELRRDPLKGENGPERYGRWICAAKLKGQCSKGKECVYAHGDMEQMYHPRTYKTKPCQHGSGCGRGGLCAFRHTDDVLTDELRKELFLSGGPAPSFHGPGESGSNFDEGASGKGGGGADVSEFGADFGAFDESFSGEGFDMDEAELEAQRQALRALEYDRQQLLYQQQQAASKPASAPPPALPAASVQATSRQAPAPSPMLPKAPASDSAVAAELEMAQRKAREEAERAELARVRKEEEEKKRLRLEAKAQKKKGQASEAVSAVAPVAAPNGSVGAAAAAALTGGLAAMSLSSSGAAGAGIGNGAAAHAAAAAAVAVLPGYIVGPGGLDLGLGGGRLGPGVGVGMPPPGVLGLGVSPAQLAQSVATVIGMLRDLPVSHSEAVLDVLGAFEEGRTGSDSLKNTALLHAVSKGVVRCVSALANTRTINAANEYKQTPLGIAVEADHRVMLTALLAAGADPNAAGGALLHALRNSSMQCAMLLAQAPQTDLRLCDPISGNTALALAAEGGLTDLVRLLLLQPAAHATINQPNMSGETPLMLAARNGHAAALLALLQARADPNALDGLRNSPLLLALLSDRGAQCVEILLQVPGIDVTAAGAGNLTPLRAAQLAGLQDVARRLVQLGAVDQAAPQQQALCRICNFARSCVQIVPCNHVPMCEPCAGNWFQRVNTCPVCQQPAEQYAIHA